jgi:hypothetical protein
VVPHDVQNPFAWGECDAYHYEMVCLQDIALAKGWHLPRDIVRLVSQCASKAVF